MYPLVELKIEPTKLPIAIQDRLDDLLNIFSLTGEHLKKIKESGKILEKSIEISNESRKAGNDLYIKKGHNSQIHNDILNLYSKSIAFAPKGTEELALGYGNRSSLLMHLHHYEESLIDIDTALQLTKDDAYLTKLQVRKEKCLELIKEKNQVKESIKASNFLNKKDQESLASKLKNFKPSATVPCASDCVGLAYNDTFGRHLIATRDIEPGEILIVEEGQVCYPLLHQIYLVCSQCLQIAWNGIPCDECVFAIYCSEACKNEARDEYHDIECPMVKYMDYTVFNNEPNGCDRMATIRLLIKAMKKEGYENIEEMFKMENQGNYLHLKRAVIC